MKYDIAITDVGITCSLGRGLPVVMQALKSNSSGLMKEDIQGYLTAVGRVHGNLDADEKFSQTRDRGTLLALDAASQTQGLFDYPSERLGVFWGVGLAGAHWIESSYRHSSNMHPPSISPWTIPAIMPNATASTLAMVYGIRGVCTTVSNACASSAVAIGQAMHAIQTGQVDAALVGGSDAMLVPGMLYAWNRMRVLARVSNKDPRFACQPFDQFRNGLCLAEGAACLVLEKYDQALRSNKNILARLTGFGQSCDAMDLTDPCIDGQVQAMNQALRSADLTPGDVGYVNAHATGTQKGDLIEATAIRQVFGEYSKRCPISSVKSAIGHTMAAAGVIEAVICIGVLSDAWIPPTRGLFQVDKALEDLNLIASEGVRAWRLQHLMSNSFGFGGVNASLLMSHANAHQFTC